MHELLSQSGDFFSRLILMMLAISALLRLCYFRNSHSRQYGFALVSFGFGVFFVTYFLHEVEFSMGFAFGLFAIFSMLRYRTESIDTREMTYLFLVIVLSLFGAAGPQSLVLLAALCALLVIIIWVSESVLCSEGFDEKQVLYEKIENITPENRDALVADLEERLGLEVSEVHVANVDFVRDSAALRVFVRRGPHSPQLSTSRRRQRRQRGGEPSSQALAGK